MGGSWLAYVFFVCVGIITIGLLWFRAIRPMLEDFGILQPADDVNRYEVPVTRPVHHYGKQTAQPASVRPISALDTDTDTDADTPPDISGAAAGQGETVYRVTEEELHRIREDERLAGVAKALGTLKGLGLLREVERAQRLTEVKNALVGTSREKQKRLNRLIEQAAAEVEPAEERELLEVRDSGDARLVER